MLWIIVLVAGLVMLVLAAVMAYVLGRAHRAWHVEDDPKLVAIEDALAGLDCGACGYPNCATYAEAIAAGTAEITLCSPGGAPTLRKLTEILGLDHAETVVRYAVVHCGATTSDRKGVRAYHGEPTCAAADVAGDVQGCAYGCLGLGDCERACPFDAIHVVDGLAAVDYEKCTACGKCVVACPRDIISIRPWQADQTLVVACCNRDPGRDVRAVCTVGCIACGICARECELFTLRRNLTHVDYDAYDAETHAAGLAAASEKCPTGCLPFRGAAGAIRGPKAHRE